MAFPRQGDLFDSGGESDGADARETPTYYPDPDEVRADLRKILTEMRAADSMPWDDSRATLYRTIFPPAGRGRRATAL